jgi:N-acyl amino acid synthase of PEP-CTERM/exosortase system
MYRYSREHGIRYWYAAMEKSLVRLLARLGVEFTKIGPLQHYHGPVMPCICDLDQLGKQLGNNNPGLLRWLRQQV